MLPASNLGCPLKVERFGGPRRGSSPEEPVNVGWAGHSLVEGDPSGKKAMGLHSWHRSIGLIAGSMWAWDIPQDWRMHQAVDLEAPT